MSKGFREEVAPPMVKHIESSVTPVTLYKEDPDRGLYIVYNKSSAPLYVKLGSGASVNDFSFIVSPQAYHVFEHGMYHAPVTGVWTFVNGFAMVTSCV